MRNGPAIVGMVFIAIFVFGAILAPIIAPYPPNVPGQLGNAMHGPS